MAWLRGVLLSACLFGMLASAPLWLTHRECPLLPVASWLRAIPSPWDHLLFGGVLASLGLALWTYRPAVLFFLGAAVFLYVGDQNRGQPWFYMYWVMLLLTLLPEAAALAACRVALAAVYVWGGIQKCNAKFFQMVPEWFVKPAAHWGAPPGVVSLLEWAVAAAPALELFIGLALWAPRLRVVAIGLAAALHLMTVLFLGPLGHGYNLVVWPWNLAMIALVITLFARAGWTEKADSPHARPAAPGASSLLRLDFAQLRRSKLALVVVVLFSVLPVLSYFGRWDSYFSFALYSGNLATADIFVTESYRERLPPRLQRFVHRVVQAYDPRVQGPYVFDHQTWSMTELGSPLIPEPRSFRAAFRHLRVHATNESEVRMIVASRGGPITFYQGDNSWTLTLPKK
jgi:hypothetical protein